MTGFLHVDVWLDVVSWTFIWKEVMDVVFGKLYAGVGSVTKSWSVVNSDNLKLEALLLQLS